MTKKFPQERIAVYPGVFDPVTNGHMDIIDRSVRIFDRVIVAVAGNRPQTIFTLEERINLLIQSTTAYPQVQVTSFEGLLIDFVREQQANAIIRGLRAVSDFELEFQYALMNQHLAEDIETFFMMSRSRFMFITTAAIKQVIRFHGCVHDLVPEHVENALWEKFHGQ
ncbi:MAG: pantetheine-phosphate adenylyltransferase [Heliobacteriaceae bacterium]|nr:pantetheine-phosphate adenylyltransferase [Heliobacteriaceae bacterium]MDD4587808.1 pantetheine-phosphate adenylyltransferase [Heliobacteriaceae bacterium]